jgi:hypothetical protein
MQHGTLTNSKSRYVFWFAQRTYLPDLSMREVKLNCDYKIQATTYFLKEFVKLG